MATTKTSVKVPPRPKPSRLETTLIILWIILICAAPLVFPGHQVAHGFATLILFLPATIVGCAVRVMLKWDHGIKRYAVVTAIGFFLLAAGTALKSRSVAEFFEYAALITMPAAALLALPFIIFRMSSPATWEKWRGRMPWVGGGGVVLFALALAGFLFLQILRALGDLN